MFMKQSYVVKTIRIVSKYVCPMVSALRHVMGATRHNNPRSSWHVFSWMVTTAGGANSPRDLNQRAASVYLAIGPIEKNSSLSRIWVNGAKSARSTIIATRC